MLILSFPCIKYVLFPLLSVFLLYSFVLNVLLLLFAKYLT